MSLDDEGAEGHAADQYQSTAQDIAGMLRARAVAIITAAGHTDCPMVQQARYIPESGAVVCGCGEFEPWSEDPESPPWAPGERSDAAEAAEMDLPAPGHPKAGTAVAVAADPIRSTLALIDPTEVYGPEDVERHILDTLYRLETGALFERETVVKAWETEQAFTTKFNARQLVNAHLRTDLCKAQSMTDCVEEHAAMAEAKMMKDAVKQTMHNLRAVLTGYQSAARSVGSAYQAGGSQGAPPQRDGRPW